MNAAAVPNRIRIALVAGAAALAINACKKEEPQVPPPIEPPPVEPTTPPPPPAEATPAAAPAAASPTDAATVVAAIQAAFNGRKWQDAVPYFADDVEVIAASSPMPPSKGKEAIGAMWQMVFAAFPDIKCTPRLLLDAGNDAFVHEHFSGTHQGPFMGTPPSNKPIGFEVMRFVTIEGGKAKKIVEYANMTAVMSQIGAIPDMPPAPLPTPPTKPNEVVKGEATAGAADAVKKMYDAIQTPDLKGLSDVIVADFVYYDMTEGKEYKGLEDNTKAVGAWKAMFPDIKLSVTAQIVVGNWVATQATSTGTHKGDMGPIKATGKVVTSHNGDLCLTEGGKLKECWGIADPAETLIHLGVIPPPAPPPGTPTPTAAPAPTVAPAAAPAK
jgi:predicted ester cyclase